MPEDLVLDGTFDRVFQFKGYDLKSGKVNHELFQNANVFLKGDGYTFLWTKNALERSGFLVTAADGIGFDEEHTYIEIRIEETKPRWHLRKNNRLYKLETIAALIEHI
jgi:iron complex transport system ATP-binding protein